MRDAGAGALSRPWPGRTSFYYGWVVLAVAALAMVGTLPGRTQGLGLITEPLLRDLRVDRVLFAQVNLWATLAGALLCVGIGRATDRIGGRLMLTSVVVCLGVAVLLMARTHSVWGLLVFVTATRAAGQSALSVVSLTVVGQWFSRRLTSAMAAYAVITTVGFMVAFLLVGGLTLSRGWRVAWGSVGVALLLFAPVAWLLVRSKPEDYGLAIDGDADAAVDVPVEPPGSTLAEALRTPAFWVFALAASFYGLVASGIALFNESILVELGFDPRTYHTTLAVTAVTALAGNFAAGAFADRGSIRHVLVAAMGLLALSLAALPSLETRAQVMGYATVMGVAGGFVMVVFFSFWGRAYGRRQLGRIQGAAQAMTVVASAVGPLPLALCVRATGSYATAFYVLAVAATLLCVAAGMVRMPAAPASGDRAIL